MCREVIGIGGCHWLVTEKMCNSPSSVEIEIRKITSRNFRDIPFLVPRGDGVGVGCWTLNVERASSLAFAAFVLFPSPRLTSLLGSLDFCRQLNLYSSTLNQRAWEKMGSQGHDISKMTRNYMSRITRVTECSKPFETRQCEFNPGPEGWMCNPLSMLFCYSTFGKIIAWHS